MKHNFSILLVMCILMVIGVALIPRLDISNGPRPKQGKTLTIVFWWQNTSAKVVEQNITSRIEAAVSTVKGVKKVSSLSLFGSGRISVEMKPNANVSMAKFEIASILRQLRRKLPENMSYPLVVGGEIEPSRADDNEEKLILTYQLYADMSEEQIRKLAEKDTKRYVEKTDGVNRVQISGTKSHYMEVTYDANEISVYGLSNNDIVEAVKNFAGREDVIGEVTANNGRVTIPLILTSKGDGKTFEQMPLRTIDGKIIYLNSLASCNIREQQPDSYYRVNGMNSVYVNVYADKDASVVNVSGKVKDALEKSANSFIAKHSTITYDRAEIQMKEFRTLLLRSSLTLAILLLFVWLAGGRNWVYTSIITIALLANILMATMLYWLFDIRLHPVSMAGITVSLGIIIDSTIVMVDHYSYYHNWKAFIGVLAAMLTTIGSLVIVFWLPDFLRHDLKDFSVVVITNLAIAIIVASIFVPALTDRLRFFNRKNIKKRTPRIRFAIAFSRIYQRYVVWCQHRIGRWASLIVFTLLFGGSLCLFVKCLNSNTYRPKQPRTVLHIRGQMPVGGSVQELNEKMKEVEAFLAQYGKDIRRFETSIWGYGGAIDVDFTDEALRTSFPYMLENRVIGKLVSIGGADWATFGVSERGFSNSLQLKCRSNSILIAGYDYDRLYSFAEEIFRDLNRNSRVADLIIRTPKHENQEDELYMAYDKRVLALSGLSPQEIHYALRSLLEESDAGKIDVTPDRQLPVVVRPTTRASFDEWSLRNSYINTWDRNIRPSEFMDINQREAKNIIPREDQEYMLEVAFNVLSSFSYTDKLIKNTMDKYNNYFPVGFRCKSTTWGTYDDEGTQYWLIGLVAVIIFFIIAILFESLMQALAVVLLIPVSFIGLFLTYYITGIPFGTGGFAAMVLLAGLTVNAGIYIICQNNNQQDLRIISANWNNRKKHKFGSKKYVTAFNHKIIPILLTILSTVLGMIPFLIDGPDDQPFWYSLAVGTIGGLIFSIVPIFLFLPSVLGLRR